VLGQFENRVRVVLCHAKVSRASRAESAYPRDKAFSGDKILPINAFWNSFETLLGLGVEPRNLTFVQISLRGIIVFLVTLVFAFLTFYSHRFGILVKGRPDVIVRDGQCDVSMMWRNHVSTHDLDEDMRLSVHTDDLSRIRVARVERSGEISFIKK
jgi:hypothetical protein